jgi:hypothetical protein
MQKQGHKSQLSIIALIPLILSIGIAPALSIENFIQEADATKAVGPKAAKSYGSSTSSEVCGDRLCSEFEPTSQASSSSRVTPSTPIPKASAEEVEEKSTITQVFFHDKTDEPVKKNLLLTSQT